MRRYFKHKYNTTAKIFNLKYLAVNIATWGFSILFFIAKMVDAFDSLLSFLFIK